MHAGLLACASLQGLKATYLAYPAALDVHPTWQAHLQTAYDDTLQCFAPQDLVFLAAAACLSLVQMLTTPLWTPANQS